MIKTISLTLLPLATLSIFNVVNDFNNSIPQPIQIKEDTRLTNTRQVLSLLKGDRNVDINALSKDIYIAATSKNIDPVLFACLIYTESQYKITAKSNKGYKGLAQTPKAAMKTGYELGDLVYGACVLDEKMKVAKGNVEMALALYKGGNNPAAHKYAKEVLELHAKIKTQLNEKG
jgi:hypothetical protein